MLRFRRRAPRAERIRRSLSSDVGPRGTNPRPAQARASSLDGLVQRSNICIKAERLGTAALKHMHDTICTRTNLENLLLTSSIDVSFSSLSKVIGRPWTAATDWKDAACTIAIDKL